MVEAVLCRCDLELGIWLWANLQVTGAHKHDLDGHCDRERIELVGCGEGANFTTQVQLRALGRREREGGGPVVHGLDGTLILKQQEEQCELPRERGELLLFGDIICDEGTFTGMTSLSANFLSQATEASLRVFVVGPES